MPSSWWPAFGWRRSASLKFAGGKNRCPGLSVSVANRRAGGAASQILYHLPIAFSAKAPYNRSSGGERETAHRAGRPISQEYGMGRTEDGQG
jgi:hypothetical protein